MKTSTKKVINGYRNTFTPKNLKVNVCAWMLENGLDEQDTNCIFADTTFADLKSCDKGVNEHGAHVIDWDRLDQFCYTYGMDSFIRDIIFDATFAIA